MTHRFNKILYALLLTFRIQINATYFLNFSTKIRNVREIDILLDRIQRIKD